MAEKALRRALDRRRTVLATAACAVLVLVLAGTVWVRGGATSTLGSQVPLAVSGSQAAPGTAAGALVALAAAGALALAGRAGGWAAGVGVAMGGALAAFSALAVITDPRGAALPAAAEAVGVPTLAGPVDVTPSGPAVVLLGAVLVALGLRAAVASGRWDRPGRRHTTTAGVGHAGERRIDPAPGSAAPGTGPSTGSATPATDASLNSAPPGAVRRGPPPVVGDDQEAWDALSRGEDPT